MLGIRLKPEEEERLARHARDSGRSKSAIVREWIVERLEREDVDAMIRRAAELHARDADAVRRAADGATDAYLRWLDAEDGGFDWGPEGPPAVR